MNLEEKEQELNKRLSEALCQLNKVVRAAQWLDLHVLLNASQSDLLFCKASLPVKAVLVRPIRHK